MEKEALDLIAQLASRGTINIDDATLALIPSNMELKDLEPFSERPREIRQTAVMQDVNSLVAYTERFAGEESSLYLNMGQGVFTVWLDHPGNGDPRWRKHKATYTPQRSLEWTAWHEMNRKRLGQVELAEFLEERIGDIVVPEPNLVLQAALEFEEAVNFVVGSTHNLDNGNVQFQFTKDNAAGRKVEFPHRLALSIPVHENEPSRTVEIRLRYRVSSEGGLSFVLSFVEKPEAILKDALEELSLDIARRLEKTVAHTYTGALGN